MAQATPIAAKVTILRHNACAHRGARITYNDVFKLAAVTPNQLRELTDIALKIANCLLLAHGLQKERFRESPCEAAESMMNALAHQS